MGGPRGLDGDDETALGSERESSTTYTLRIVGAGSGVSFPFEPDEHRELVVGRGNDAQLRAPLAGLSRRHALVRFARGGLAVKDLGSSHGTHVREERIPPNEWRYVALREPILVGGPAVVLHRGKPSDGPRRLFGEDDLEAVLTRRLTTAAPGAESCFGVFRVVGEGEPFWTEYVASLLGKGDATCFLSEAEMALVVEGVDATAVDRLAGFFRQALPMLGAKCEVSVRVHPRNGRTIAELWPPFAQRRSRGEKGAAQAAAPPAPVVKSAAMQAIHSLIAEIASTPVSVLVLGETGVGKDVIARVLHERSDRRRGPLVTLNCAALPENLLESELFGYERGAFTGAQTAKPGLLESAHGGTVFLDEVGEMPLSTQAKLLRVLEERRVQRLGGLKAKDVDFRLVAATNRDLAREIAQGRFRADLFYRINGIVLEVPPLRERREEIGPLARHFAETAAIAMRKTVPTLDAAVIKHLESYAWPGNIRELKSVVERAVLLSRGGVVTVEQLPRLEENAPPSDELAPSVATIARMSVANAAAAPMTVPPIPHAPPSAGSGSLREELERIEMQRIIETLNAHAGNQTRAAKALGMTRKALIVRLERYGLPRPRRDDEDE